MSSKSQPTLAADTGAGTLDCKSAGEPRHDDRDHPLAKAFVKPAVEPSKLSTAAQALALSLLYIIVSAGMIMFNKFMMRPYVFPFAVTLTTMHQFSALILASLLRQAVPSLFPTAHIVFARVGQKPAATHFVFGQASNIEITTQTARERITELVQALLPFSPIAVCGAVSMVGGNAAYQHASVAFLQMVKESQIVMVYIFMLMAGLETFRFRLSMVLSFVALSAVVAVYGEVYFSRTGLILQVVAGMCGSGQIVLNNRLMSQSAGPKIDPLTMVLCTAPVMLAVLLPANLVSWSAQIPVLMMQWAPQIICNCILAFALQVATAILIKRISGTGFALACVAKDLSIVAAAACLLHEHLSLLQVVGFAGTILGMCLYSAMKMYPAAFEPAKEAKDKEKCAADGIPPSSSISTCTSSPDPAKCAADIIPPSSSNSTCTFSPAPAKGIDSSIMRQWPRPGDVAKNS